MTDDAVVLDPLIGLEIDHYRILERVGSGGMGVVYRGYDAQLEREVAIKALPLGTIADERARKRFRNEARALSKLNHPNIATVHDFHSQNGRDFLVMEFIEGVTLNQKLTFPGTHLCIRKVTARWALSGTQQSSGTSSPFLLYFFLVENRPVNERRTLAFLMLSYPGIGASRKRQVCP